MRNLIGIVALSLLAAVAGCASDDTSSKQATSPTVSDPNDPFAELEQNLDRFTGSCSTVDAAGLLTVTLPTAAVTIISKNIVNSQIMANGQECGASTAVKRIVVNGGTGNDTVIVDYTNGLFAPGAAATSTAIELALSTGTDTIGIKGTSAVDKVTMGQNTTQYYADMNTDSKPDLYINKTGTQTVKLHMGAGNDIYSGGTFAASTSDIGLFVYGGEGDDTFNQPAALTYKETMDGGAGTDTVTYAARTSTLQVTVTVGSGSDDGSSTEVDAIQSSVEIVTGTPGNDTMTAAAGGSRLNGGAGVDTLIGGAGADSLSGDDGNDSITGGPGADTLSGGAGDDTFSELGAGTSSGADVINGGAGTDTVDYSTRTAVLTVTMDGTAANDGESGEGDNVKGDIENIICGTGADVITGNALSNIITGGDGNDSLSGGAGHDIFVEGSTSTGADTLVGGAGTDTVDYSSRTLAVTVVMNGASSSGQGSEADLVGADIEQCYGGSGADNITGNALANLLFGGAGNDSLYGLAGDDEIDGGSSTTADTIDAGDGDGDICYGDGTTSETNCEF